MIITRQQDLQQYVWFTEWAENKIAKLNTNDKLLPFSVVLPSISHNNDITIKRGESKQIKRQEILGILHHHLVKNGFR